MKEAAEHFAVLLSQRNAGGETRVEVQYMSLDGMTGHYVVYFNQPVEPVDLLVHRGDQAMEPKDAGIEL